MAGLSASSGGGWDYIQADEPADPENAELWFDTDAGPDGQGEVKVYDGSEWQATGYISHDQLQNVAPADHHDPVTVSAPLTRSGQALALALGNALTLDNNDDLAVDESAISLSNLSGYPVGTGDLAFDTATQSELDNHESDPDAHHNPVTVSAPLTRSGQALALALGNALTLDGNNDLMVSESDISHDNISGVTDADHHDPVTVSAPLTRSGQALALALGNALTLDGNNDLAVSESDISLSNLSGYPVGTGDLAFDTATQSELDSHKGDTTNPHNVTDDQTGAAAALSNHKGDTSNPHNVTDDQTGAAAALSNHESDPDRHHARPGSTQSTSVTTGFKQFVRHVTTNYPRPTKYSEVFPVEGAVSRIRLKNSNGSQTAYAVELQGGSRLTGTVSGATGGSESEYGVETVTVNDRVMAVSVENTGVEPYDIDWLLAGGHSHQI